jgi:putative transposase
VCRKRFTEEQIIGILKETEAGGKATDLCRRHGISKQTGVRIPLGPPNLVYRPLQ